MKKPTIIAIACIAVAILAFVIVRQKSALPPSVIGENIAPQLITDEAWQESIAEDPTAHGYSGYYILQDRRSDAAILEGLRDLRSDDGYVWVNAASYLGSRGNEEAVPYLIKALRHTAWRSDDERVESLRKLTGETFGNSFEDWFNWYAGQPNPINIDWESSLGHAPRLPKSNREQKGGAGQSATRSQSGSEGGDKPQPESEDRSR
ncbi:MAG: hypothetical protein EOP83_16765 [Verrucomicrobiaceae bacterium]|nr:MAG: hypothetical protein EOP83_16765 [Verrucomicrobiaceae bacterium]